MKTLVDWFADVMKTEKEMYALNAKADLIDKKASCVVKRFEKFTTKSEVDAAMNALGIRIQMNEMCCEVLQDVAPTVTRIGDIKALDELRERMLQTGIGLTVYDALIDKIMKENGIMFEEA